jgi:hypothetical protein
MSLLTAILPAWGYHLVDDYSRIGNLFLSLTAGFLGAAVVGPKLIRERGSPFQLVAGASVGLVSTIYLSSIPLASTDLWRAAGLVGIGFSAGLLNGATFHAISALYRQDRAATVNLAGILFGSGCLVTAVVMRLSLESGGPYVVLFTVAATAGICATIFASLKSTHAETDLAVRPRTASVNNPSAVVFGLLLFFPFGNEWAIAGWLAVFLIHRLGISPGAALTVLAMYWLSLLFGRVAAQWLFGRVKHGRMLAASAGAATFGCTILAVTDNLFGIVLGILLAGFAFASIYPLVIERIGSRFPSYQPGLFNGIFTFALIGGTAAPWTLGYFAEYIGIQAVMILPVIGTCAVLLLLVVTWIEARFSGRPVR